MNRLKFFGILTVKQRLSLIPVFILTVISSGLEVFGLGLLIPFFQYLSDPESIARLPEVLQTAIAYLPGNNHSEVAMSMALLLIAVFVLKGLISILTTWVRTRTVYRLYRGTASRVLSNHLNAPVTYITSQNSAEVIRTVSNDTQAFFTGYIIPALVLMADLIPLIAILIAMLIIDPIITLVAIFGLGVVTGGIMFGLRRLIVHWGRIRRRALGDMMRWVSQGVGGIKEVQVLGVQHYITDEYDRAAQDLADASIIHSISTEAPRYAIEILVVATLVGFTMILQGGDQPVSVWMPRLVFFGASAIRLAPSAMRMVSSVNQLRANQANAEVVYESLHTMPQHVSRRPQSLTPFAFEEQVTFKDVVVQYPNAHEPALKGLNLHINHGETIALVGPTGAGKTTAIDVLLGLIRPDSGAVYVDGVDITGNEDRWQPRLGYVPQFIYLADLSIRENIAFGVPPDQVNDDHVWEALRFAAIDDFVRDLPDQLSTRVGERGVMLSGGQRQRIGIARALYFKPEILVMDEATSALDSETERKIAEATQRLQGAVTMVLIAHRITTVRHADRILILDNGQLLDAGNFEELAARSELFRQLARGLEGVSE